ncbi:MAG TPA: DUF1499 domain-containing protein, partial [Thermodesulfovibrionales bacterium]|nr:DUF1499 domain-containing protein [Thermodesulfovibrionales bacterium]
LQKEPAMEMKNKSHLAFATFCLVWTAVFAIALILAGTGTHLGWWGFRNGLAILRWSAYAEIGMAVLSLACFVIAAAKRSGAAVITSVLALILALAAAALPVRMWMTFRSVPMIHDVTTDMDNPPLFNAILKLRKDAQNPVEYGGAEVAAQQRRAYPDLAPLILDIPPDAAFERCLGTVNKMGWEMVRADPAQGIIEATDTTFWFRFKDDIVVRVTPSGSGSRVDVRSVSRVGKSDVGTNARRIRAFLDNFRKRE